MPRRVFTSFNTSAKDGDACGRGPEWKSGPPFRGVNLIRNVVIVRIARPDASIHDEVFLVFRYAQDLDRRRHVPLEHGPSRLFRAGCHAEDRRGSDKDGFPGMRRPLNLRADWTVGLADPLRTRDRIRPRRQLRLVDLEERWAAEIGCANEADFLQVAEHFDHGPTFKF